MVKSIAPTVQAYLDELPEERRQVVSAVRDVILANLPAGYEEAMNWGMICYEVPLSRYPDTYNGQPLAYAALAAQKNKYSLYLSIYQRPDEDDWFRAAYLRTGKKLDMGKGCVRFKRVDDLPLELVADVISHTPPEEFVARHEAARRKT